MKRGEDRLAIWRGLVYAGYGGVVLLYAAGAFAFICQSRAGIALINLATLAYFLGARRLDKHYSGLFVRESLKSAYGRRMDGTQILKGRPEIHGPGLGGLIPAKSKGGLAWGVGLCGLKRGNAVNICDVLACFDRTKEQAAGHKVGLADGIWFQACKSRAEGKTLLILSRSLAKKGISADFYESQGLCSQSELLGAWGGEYLLFAEPGCTKEEVQHFLRRFEAVLKKEKTGGLAVRQDKEGISAFLSGCSLDFSAPLKAARPQRAAAAGGPVKRLLECV